MQKILKPNKKMLTAPTIWCIATILILCSCVHQEKTLPILGQRTIENGDTIYHKIRPFSFMNQDSQIIDNETLSGKIYVADFFFTHCPTICPKVTSQLKRVYDKYKDNPNVQLISFSLDPKRDTIGRLADYAAKLGVSSKKWSFLTGEKEKIWELASDYFSIAVDDEDAAGGINHSGRLILVDPQGRVRSYCQGTEEKSVDQFLKDIDVLLKEYH